MSRVAALSSNDSSNVGGNGRGWFAWLETALITLLSAAIAQWLTNTSSSAFQVSSIWLLAPVVCGLRRGSIHGLTSGAGAVAVAAVWDYPIMLAWSVLMTHGATMLIVGGVAGEISDWWRRRLLYVEAQSRYHRVRLEEFSREYHSLRLSHERLERKLSGGAISLRNALVQLDQSISRKPLASHEPLGGLAESILRLFAEHGPLHVAAIYSFSHADQFTVCAALGSPPPLTAGNILIQKAFRTGQVSSIPSLTGPDVEGVIAVVPLTDINGETQAAVAIYDMPYAMFQPSTLSMLAVIGSHVGDLLRRNRYIHGVGDITKEFTTAIQLCIEDYRRCGLPFAFLVFKFDPAVVNGSVTETLMNGRGTDRVHACNDRAGSATILKLMPLADQSGAASLIRRVACSVKAEPDSLAEFGVHHFVWSVSPRTAAREHLLQFIDRCGIELVSGDGDVAGRKAQPDGYRARNSGAVDDVSIRSHGQQRVQEH